MDFLTPEELAALERVPVKQTRPRTTKAKKESDRTYSTWFKVLKQHFGTCSNPECSDPRPKSEYPVTMVSTLASGHECCRFCFLAGYE